MLNTLFLRSQKIACISTRNAIHFCTFSIFFWRHHSHTQLFRLVSTPDPVQYKQATFWTAERSAHLAVIVMGWDVRIA